MTRILFLQLPPPRFCFEESPSNIPLAAGFLVAALEAQAPDRLCFEIGSPEIVDVLADEALAFRIAEMRPAALGMTLYVWNVQRSLFLAANIKARSPGTRVFVGGPEVTLDNQWVLEHPAIDGGVFGEGESRIAPFLNALLFGTTIERVSGAFLRDRGLLAVNENPVAPWDLSACPYPYLDGKISPSIDGTLFLETVRGCPFRCRYCYYHKAFGNVRAQPEQSVEAVLDLAYAPDSPVREIYLMDPTFNAQKGFRRSLRSLARRRSAKDVAVHTELRADLLTDEDVLLLQEAGVKSAEVGLQTVNRAALAEAGRSGDPEHVARGVALLKDAGIEVTTGIILGLPGDTPEGFAQTLAWLKSTQCYSVVHPFVLSVLPGTDFRTQASSLGLKYHPRPPYYVRSTPTFPEEEFQRALLECERTFDMELDHIPRPSLVDGGFSVVGRFDETPYISKWVLDPNKEEQWQRTLPLLMTRVTDPFTLWFRKTQSEKAILDILRKFVTRNPHMVLNVVLEFPRPPELEFLDDALQSVADRGLFVNRSYESLYGEGAIVSPDFTVILPDPGHAQAREEIAADYASTAAIVWDMTDFRVRDDLFEAVFPVLFSPPAPESADQIDRLLDELESAWRTHPDDIMFRDARFQREWDRRVRKVDHGRRLPERILVTV